jgi:hypothetical protein
MTSYCNAERSNIKFCRCLSDQETPTFTADGVSSPVNEIPQLDTILGQLNPRQ